MKIAITFQQRYEYDTHPVVPEVTAKSYMVFEGEDAADARAKAVELLNSDFAFAYPLDDDFQRQISEYGLREVAIPTTAL